MAGKLVYPHVPCRSSFTRAMKLFSTVSGRRDYTDPVEKFENVTLMLFEPYTDKRRRPRFRLFVASRRDEITAAAYCLRARQIYTGREPPALSADTDLNPAYQT